MHLLHGLKLTRPTGSNNLTVEEDRKHMAITVVKQRGAKTEVA
jgi:hypothetical protein